MPNLPASLIWAALAGAAAMLVLLMLRARYFSFTAQRPGDYADTGPAFDPRKVLNGKIDSEGVIFGPTGRAVSRFVMRMEGRWTGTSGILTEDFTYDSGRRQKREWRLTQRADGGLDAEADDIVGTGKGEIAGAALRLSYRLRLPEDAGGHVLDVIDWLYLMPDGTIMNRSQMGRFGLPLAELIATMRPAGAVLPEAAAEAAEPAQAMPAYG